MNQPRLIRIVFLLAVLAAASAQADSMAELAGSAARAPSATADGCTGTLRAASGVVGSTDSLVTRVIFHDGSHAPVSVPVSERELADSAAVERGGGGSSTPIVLPGSGTEPSKSRTGPRWQSFLPGSLK